MSYKRTYQYKLYSTSLTVQVIQINETQRTAIQFMSSKSEWLINNFTVFIPIDIFVIILLNKYEHISIENKLKNAYCTP